MDAISLIKKVKSQINEDLQRTSNSTTVAFSLRNRLSKSDTTSDELHKYHNHPDPTVRLVVANHANVDPNTLDLMKFDDHYQVKSAIISNNRRSKNTLKSIIDDPNTNEMSRLIARKKLSHKSMTLEDYLFETLNDYKYLFESKFDNSDVVIYECVKVLVEGDYPKLYDDLSKFIEEVLGMDETEVPPELRSRLTKLKAYPNIRNMIQKGIPLQAENCNEDLHRTDAFFGHNASQQTLQSYLKNNPHSIEAKHVVSSHPNVDQDSLHLLSQSDDPDVVHNVANHQNTHEVTLHDIIANPKTSEHTKFSAKMNLASRSLRESLTDEQEGKKETIVKALKQNTDYFKRKYGKDYKDVMYAIATSKAKNESIDLSEAKVANMNGRELEKHLRKHGWTPVARGQSSRHKKYEYTGDSKIKPKYPIAVPEHKGDLNSITAGAIHNMAIPDNFEKWNIKYHLSEECLIFDELNEQQMFHVKFDDGSTIVLNNATDRNHALQLASIFHPDKKALKAYHHKEIHTENYSYEGHWWENSNKSESNYKNDKGETAKIRHTRYKAKGGEIAPPIHTIEIGGAVHNQFDSQRDAHRYLSSRGFNPLREDFQNELRLEIIKEAVKGKVKEPKKPRIKEMSAKHSKDAQWTISGGETLTGNERDNVQINPIIKNKDNDYR